MNVNRELVLQNRVMSRQVMELNERRTRMYDISRLSASRGISSRPCIVSPLSEQVSFPKCITLEFCLKYLRAVAAGLSLRVANAEMIFFHKLGDRLVSRCGCVRV